MRQSIGDHETSRTTLAPRSMVRTTIDPLVGRRLEDVERDLVLATLTRCGGNRTWAADILGLAPAQLRERLINYRNDVEQNARDAKRREAEMEADLRRADGATPRATYLPSTTFLA